MKRLLATLTLLFSILAPVTAQDALNPTSEQLDQAIQQMKKMGIDTSKLPSKDTLQQMLSGENGRRLHEMAKKMQAQNPKQFQQMQDRMKHRFDKNGDGKLGPKELELAQQALKHRHSDHSDQRPVDHPRLSDKVSNHFDQNDDGHLGPRERDAAQNAIRLRRSNQDGVPSKDRPSAPDRALNRFDRNSDGQLGPLERNAAKRVRQQPQLGDSQNAIRLRRPSSNTLDSHNATSGAESTGRNSSRPHALNQSSRPTNMSLNRSSRSGGQQSRANGTSRTPQSSLSSQVSRNPQQPTSSSRSPRSRTAGSRSSQTAAGASRRGSSTSGPSRAGTSRGGSSVRGGR